MKALGRRIKTWRQAAALLPDADERELSAQARSARLRQKAETATDARQAAQWLERAVAMTMDDYGAWDALADAYSRAGDMSRAVFARREGLAAFGRVTPLAPIASARTPRALKKWRAPCAKPVMKSKPSACSCGRMH